MKVKSTIKSVIAILLVVCAVFSMAACTKEDEKSRDKLENQYETNRYYFRQGYTNLWKPSLKNDEQHLVSGYENQGLALQLVPLERTESGTDEEGNKTYTPGEKTVEGVQYNVFCNWDKDGLYMTLSANDIAGYVMDETQPLFFNSVNYIDNPRANYLQAEESQSVTYNKLQWTQVSFTFTGDDGEQWKGIWNLLTKGTDYYVVSYEAHADKYDTYLSEFETIIGDFKKIGWESDDSVG